MAFRPTALALAVLLVSAVCAQPPGQSNQGKRPPGEPIKNQAGKDVGKTPPPIAESKRPESGGKPPPKVEGEYNKAGRTFLLSSNGFNVEVNAAAGLPFFRFWSDPNKMQMVKLDRMFQTSTPNDLSSSGPLSPVQLTGAYTWQFSDASSQADADTNTTDVKFTVTGTPRNTVNNKKPVPGLVFTCHLLSNANGTEMKFDVSVSDWQSTWWDGSAKALVLGYKVTRVDQQKRDVANLTMSDIRIQKGAKRPNRPEKAENRGKVLEKVAMDFGNGNGFEIVSTATDATGASIPVSMTAVNTPNGGSYVLTIYDKFGGGGFTHDPSLYTASTSGTVDAGSAQTTTFDGSTVISIGEDTGVAPNLAATPAPGESGGSGSSGGAGSLRAQWVVCAGALVAALAALADRF